MTLTTKKTLFFIATILLISSNIAAKATTYEKIWTSILNDNVMVSSKNKVITTLVDYSKIKSDPRFPQILSKLNKIDPKNFKFKDQHLAFWINVYNITTIKIIVENYNNIQSNESLDIWKNKAISINNKKYSLAEIKNDILRPFKDPRIHFALVNGSISAPNLRQEAYSASTVDTQLKTQIKAFLQNSSKGLFLNYKKQIIYVSKIFNWFKKDFNTKGGIYNFIQMNTTFNLDYYRIDFLPYDWSANDLGDPNKKE